VSVSEGDRNLLSAFPGGTKMKYTGVKATEEELKMLQRMLKIPVIYLSGGRPIGGDPVKECHRLALAHGLPEIQGYYGITAEGEFIET
jgi:hypothetical protein